MCQNRLKNFKLKLYLKFREKNIHLVLNVSKKCMCNTHDFTCYQNALYTAINVIFQSDQFAFNKVTCLTQTTYYSKLTNNNAVLLMSPIFKKYNCGNSFSNYVHFSLSFIMPKSSASPAKACIT